MMNLIGNIKNSRVRFFIHNILLFTFLSFSGMLIQQGLLSLLLFGQAPTSFIFSYLKLVPFWNENRYWSFFEFIHLTVPIMVPKLLLFSVFILIMRAASKQDTSLRKNRPLYFFSIFLTFASLLLTLVSFPYKEFAPVGTYELIFTLLLGVLLVPSGFFLLFWSSDEVINGSKITQRKLLIGLFVVLVFSLMLPGFFTKAEIVRQQSRPISKNNQWVIAYKGNEKSTKSLVVFNNLLFALKEYPNKLLSYDGRTWKEIRQFASVRVTGMVSSDKELLVFGKAEGGYDADTLFYRYNGSAWRDMTFLKPNTGWEPRSAWWDGQLYLVGADFSLYRLEDKTWVFVSKLPEDVVSEVRKVHDVRGINLVSHNGQLYVVMSGQIYTYDTDWKKVEITGQLPFETAVAESWKGRLFLAGCCYPNHFSVLDGTQINSPENKVYDKIYDLSAFSDTLYVAAGRDGVWKFDREKFQKDTTYAEAYGSEGAKYYLDPREFGSVNTMVVYNDKLYVGGELSPYIYMHKSFN